MSKITVSKNDVENLAVAVKLFFHTLAKPIRVTVLVCWTNGNFNNAYGIIPT